mgnify:CR=1 FL=1|jgi:hypothetical protein
MNRKQSIKKLKNMNIEEIREILNISKILYNDSKSLETKVKELNKLDKTK